MTNPNSDFEEDVAELEAEFPALHRALRARVFWRLWLCGILGHRWVPVQATVACLRCHRYRDPGPAPPPH